jgi:hypothetical protein
LVDTAVIGAAGAGLTALPWNAAWDAEVQSECTDALNAYDPPTNAEMIARTLVAADYTIVSDLPVAPDNASITAILEDTGTTLPASIAAIPSVAKKNTALANFAFIMTDSTDHEIATGLTVTCTRSIDGSAFSSGTLANVTEVGSGVYNVDFGAGDLNGDCVVLRATATGADDTFVSIVTAK